MSLNLFWIIFTDKSSIKQINIGKDFGLLDIRLTTGMLILEGVMLSFYTK